MQENGFHLPQERRNELHELSPGDHLLVEDNQAAKEVFVCFCAPQSFADLAERREEAKSCCQGETELGELSLSRTPGFNIVLTTDTQKLHRE